jgi:N-acetylglucosaminyldiphosphoundecaprenol N-acetyl-beta-D-mannosaminyltransferase
MLLPQFKILSQPINLCPNYLEWIVERLKSGIGTHVVTMNAEIVIQANRDPELAQIIREADVVTADGAGITLALKLYGIAQTKCAGIELGESLLKLAASAGYRVLLYGGKPEVVTKAAQNWQDRLPSLDIIGVYHGYLDETEIAALDRVLIDEQPQIILVAMGAPRQDRWIRDRRKLCPQAVWVGVGGSFDVWSGLKQRAPIIWQKLNLEWLYRLFQDPSRWQRIFALPQFALLALGERIGIGGK